MTTPVNAIDPLGVSDLISTTYRRYLRSLMPLRDPALAEALREQIDTSPLLSKGPLLEATPPYATGATPGQLVEEGVLSPGFAAPGGPRISLDRPLYAHQEAAIRKARAGRNLVVATGTGSGKTESFLVPILNALEEEREQGTLGPGVRAVLLYPMNALANDQLKRLREELLAASPHITFGRYTGETRNTERDALEQFRKMHGTEPLPNELISREQMRENPPHLLLTNYAMLEYLLLRPADLDLFEGEHSGHWRFIALDEAHVYDGAKAAEIAMLLRRLRDRVARGRELQCIATSATVGDDPAKVTEFASKLFDAPFEWDGDDPDRQDLVTATRRLPRDIPSWGPLPVSAYGELTGSEDPGSALRGVAAFHGVVPDDPAVLLAGEARMRAMREALAQGPRTLADLAAEVFADEPEPLEPVEQIRVLAELVALGSRVRDVGGSPLLSARYHLFTRATDGAFACLDDEQPHVSLARHETCEGCGSPAFELGSCRRCGDVYLVGSVRQEGNGPKRFLPQQSPHEKLVWLRLGPAVDVVDDDEETLSGEAAKVTLHSEYLCTACGTLSDSPHDACIQGCPGRSLREVQRISSRGTVTERCLNCGALGRDTLLRFQSGSEAAVAVVATSLYQSLPEDPDPRTADQPGGGRKLLMFSDSRQTAAFFAPYLGNTYKGLFQRRLIVQGMQKRGEIEGGLAVKDVINDTVKAATRAEYFKDRTSNLEKLTEVGPWVMSELVSSRDRQSLEGRGLIRVELMRPHGVEVPRAFTDMLGLSEDEAWNLFGELMRSARQQGVLTMPDDVPADHEDFAPRRGPIAMREVGSDAKRKVLSWSPTGRTNGRLNYMERLLARIGAQVEPRLVLQKVWEFLHGIDNGWLAYRDDRTLGRVRQVDHEYLRIFLVGPEETLFRCGSCRRLHSVSVRGVCTTVNCDGTLAPVAAGELDREGDHYRALYQELSPVPLRAEEHTAQWSSEKAAEVQQKFVAGSVNALSCSTTFELGVDVGELQTVLMRNMPPTTANYVQRAGRAGRRAASAALVVTHAQRRSHDMFRYQEPEQMISGTMPTPYVPLTNERIDRRHAHSVALAAFFRHWALGSGETWSKVGDFFHPKGGNAPVHRVAEFLDPVPEEITGALLRILPGEVSEELGVKDGSWVAVLTDMLEDIRKEVVNDIDHLDKRRQEAADKQRYGQAQQFAKTIKTIRTRGLLGFLATRNVLPKYGFPVDTVELRTSHTGDPVGAELELARDLSTAIHEYAPGAQVVAGGKRWTSAGVYRMPGKELVEYHYRLCETCGHYEDSTEKLEPACTACGNAPNRAPGMYSIPEFGFVADSKTHTAGTTPPERVWRGFTQVRNLAAEPEEYTWPTARGGLAHCQAGSRGQLIVVSEGRHGGGFYLCRWCGWGASVSSNRAPASHNRPLTQQPCQGRPEKRSLGHQYETDLLSVAFGGPLNLGSVDDEVRQSLLYALLEGASAALEISRDDIDGTVFHSERGQKSLVLFDTVPGGAGGAVRIAQGFPEVLRAAHARVNDCDCGVETSCYGCLRNYRNQNVHDRLRRRDALQALELLLVESDAG
ncbi:DEAD/DEAH box helicase [Nocardiopsis algeriensis]|uniref:Putative nucleic acid-binding Zn-ribbon protein n=1 Tax=Nocardiopsis algeriensis TaxID=1478215 RepID=A0A841IMU0_9ACTN|nr:DEAD/DEAH box helicase [Nocardiopsis algeriensis]MBB6119500.1 putative nucleic acid-binding Zn-ribbon protein [Nocardiopsis algeriensis]